MLRLIFTVMYVLVLPVVYCTSPQMHVELREHLGVHIAQDGVVPHIQEVHQLQTYTHKGLHIAQDG